MGDGKNRVMAKITSLTRNVALSGDDDAEGPMPRRPASGNYAALLVLSISAGAPVYRARGKHQAASPEAADEIVMLQKSLPRENVTEATATLAAWPRHRAERGIIDLPRRACVALAICIAKVTLHRGVADSCFSWREASRGLYRSAREIREIVWYLKRKSGEKSTCVRA